MTKTITVAYGDGIGPEIMEACLFILKEAGADIEIETIEVGEKVYKMGNSTGIPKDAWDSLKRNKVFLKAPITTPQGGGYKSLNVTIRKSLGLYSNVRPVRSYFPYVNTSHEKMDMVIVRENEEDIYAGIEYRQTPDVFSAIKLISRTGSERIARYAFEYALANNRKKVTCMSKDNIMKLCDGIFHKAFDEVAKEYPQIESDHYIIDIGSARVASRPQDFDVIVTENLYGDIISDIAADVSGSVGLAGSSNIGGDFAMFEAIHGSAPDIAGQNIANPSGLINGAVMMLVHIGQPEVATSVQNALLKTIEDGMHTGDLVSQKTREKLGTEEFAQAVVERLGQKPDALGAVEYKPGVTMDLSKKIEFTREEKTLVGTDVFVAWERELDELGEELKKISDDRLAINLISAKGLKIWPQKNAEIKSADQYRCRFYANAEISNEDVTNLLSKFSDSGIEFLKIENLYNFDGERGYSLAQGE